MLDNYKKIQKERMAQILNEILSSRQITRGTLAGKLHMSHSSVTKYSKDLIELGLIREIGFEHSSGGRRSALLEFDPEIGVNIVVVFNLSFIEGALINPAGTVIQRSIVKVWKDIPAQTLLNKFLDLVGELVASAEKSKRRIFGIGLGIGDHLDMEQGISHDYHLSRDWREVNLKSIVESKFNFPFFLINDLDAGALGEKYYGYGKNSDNFVCVWIDETVGMGLVLNGVLYVGKNGYVGEIGHTRALVNGPLCLCGNRGCLETVTSESYILEKCRGGLSEGVNSDTIRLCRGDLTALTIDHMIAASNNGDRFCRNIFEETADFLGKSLTDAVNILNPELISLRGSAIDGNTYLFETVTRYIKNRALEPISRDLQIVHSEKREDIRLPGVSSYILSRYF